MLSARWTEATARERLGVIVTGVVVCSAALFLLLVRPAWRVIQGAPSTLAALDAKVLKMRAQAADMRTTPAAGSVAAAASAATSPALTAERELKSPGATVSVARDRGTAAQMDTTLHLAGVEGARLAAWLAQPEVQRQLQRLTVTRDPASGRVTGTAVLRGAS